MQSHAMHNARSGKQCQARAIKSRTSCVWSEERRLTHACMMNCATAGDGSRGQLRIAMHSAVSQTAVGRKHYGRQQRCGSRSLQKKNPSDFAANSNGVGRWQRTQDRMLRVPSHAANGHIAGLPDRAYSIGNGPLSVWNGRLSVQLGLLTNGWSWPD